MAMPATLMTAAKRCKHGEQPRVAARAAVAAAFAMRDIHKRQRGAAALGNSDLGQLYNQAKEEIGRCLGAALRFVWLSKVDLDREWVKNVNELGARFGCVDRVEHQLKDDILLEDTGNGAIERLMRVSLLLARVDRTQFKGEAGEPGRITQLCAIAGEFEGSLKRRKKAPQVAHALALLNCAAVTAQELGLGAPALWFAASGRRIEPIE